MPPVWRVPASILRRGTQKYCVAYTVPTRHDLYSGECFKSYWHLPAYLSYPLINAAHGTDFEHSLIIRQRYLSLNGNNLRFTVDVCTYNTVI